MADRAKARVSLRRWARSRAVPSSTAFKAAVAGRISRFADGTVDPLVADREWLEHLPPRVDARRLEVPNEMEFGPLTRAELKARLGPVADSTEEVALVDCLRVEVALDDYLARALVVAIDRAALDVVPRLRSPRDAGWVLDRLHRALLDAWDQTEKARVRFYEAGDEGDAPDELTSDGGAD
jgi:hypothetical protein